MQQFKNLRWSVLLLLLTLNFGCDQVSKKIVRTEISDYEHISIIKDRFTLTKVENSGAFLSLGDNMPYIFRLIILTGLPLLFLGYGLYFLFAKRNLPMSMQIALCFLIGGGIGNLYDRIVHGSVTDFMHMDFYLFQTGVFNFADISIMIGVGILLFQSIRSKRLKHEVD
ncbi:MULTISPECIES: signal peptidase II [unclassified Pedobacter]|uniref:signal peptidase II n=1 Tax=unclassified Pedobacter TaxID=2628915 RepID=UPI001D61BC66|nr:MULTISPECIES: signal peptidase II [unclassified Pedobacter]CAH0161382.1 Lipoprotein signal peptidase [Pedobacter sp. Bi36]CAH0217188.1 Lipoprotein signal peptidase [Pedobacter sp. Bi126]